MVAIRRLRTKLDEPFETKLLHTVRGMGYVLEVREEGVVVEVAQVSGQAEDLEILLGIQEVEV